MEWNVFQKNLLIINNEKGFIIKFIYNYLRNKLYKLKIIF